MGRLTRWGIGCYLCGMSGNIIIEVYPMTNWTISQELAQWIVFICIGFMTVGVLLILTSLKKTKGKYDEHLAVTNEMLRVYQGQLGELDRVAVSEIMRERSEKRQITQKLLLIDNCFSEAVERQDLTAEILKSIAPQMFRWYDWIILVFIFVTNLERHLKHLFRNMLINYIIKFTSRLNVILRQYDLGTLPTFKDNQDYINTYKSLINLESGLPLYITAKIHRNVLLSASINSLRIFRANSSFWENMEAKKLTKHMNKALVLIKNVLPLFMVILDGVVTGLRSEITADIEKYIVVKKNEL